jgi:hypothetical protein
MNRFLAVCSLVLFCGSAVADVQQKQHPVPVTLPRPDPSLLGLSDDDLQRLYAALSAEVNALPEMTLMQRIQAEFQKRHPKPAVTK